MGQSKVVQFLKQSKTYKSSRQIADGTGMTRGAVHNALVSLKKWKMIDMKMLKRKGYKGIELFRAKR